jgi:hypothetical protein
MTYALIHMNGFASISRKRFELWLLTSDPAYRPIGLDSGRQLCA